MLSLLGGGGTERGLMQKFKPGLLFLLRLAWDSKARLPLIIVSGFMALGVRIQMEINIERAANYMPRLRLQEEEEPFLTDSDDASDWTTDEAGYETDYYDDEEEEENREEVNRPERALVESPIFLSPVDSQPLSTSIDNQL